MLSIIIYAYKSPFSNDYCDIYPFYVIPLPMVVYYYYYYAINYCAIYIFR